MSQPSAPSSLSDAVLAAAAAEVFKTRAQQLERNPARDAETIRKQRQHKSFLRSRKNRSVRLANAQAEAAQALVDAADARTDATIIRAVQGDVVSNFDIGLNYLPDAEAREQARANRHERRTLEKLSGGAYTPEQWQEVLALCGNACARCGLTENLIVDHIRPVHLGGSSSIENLQPLCRSCNSSKGTKIIDYRPKRPPKKPPA